MQDKNYYLLKLDDFSVFEKFPPFNIDVLTGFSRCRMKQEYSSFQMVTFCHNQYGVVTIILLERVSHCILHNESDLENYIFTIYLMMRIMFCH